MHPIIRSHVIVHLVLADRRYPGVPPLAGHGWKLAEDDTNDYEWTSGFIFFPQDFVDALCGGTSGLEL